MGKVIDLPEFIKERRCYGRSWDFLDQPAVSLLPLNTVTLEAAAAGNTGATLVGVVPTAVRVTGGYLASSVATTGVDANNTSTWTITDHSGTTICTKVNSANLTANTPVAFSAPAAPDVSAGTGIRLAVTNAGTANAASGVAQVTITVADYNNFPAPGLKVIDSDGGTVAIADGQAGKVTLTPKAATDNAEQYLVATTETVKFDSGKTFIGEALLQYAEGNTDDANVIFGFMNAVAANALVDNGGGPKATGDYACIWKVDGGTQWYAGAQTNGTQYPTTDTLGSTTIGFANPVTAGGATAQYLRVLVTPTSSTQAVAEFEVDGVNIATIHFAYASATEMQLFVGVKNGSTTGESVVVDYLGYSALR